MKLLSPQKWDATMIDLLVPPNTHAYLEWVLAQSYERRQRLVG